MLMFLNIMQYMQNIMLFKSSPDHFLNKRSGDRIMARFSNNKCITGILCLRACIYELKVILDIYFLRRVCAKHNLCYAEPVNQ